MVVTLLGSLFGFIASLAPEFFKFYRDRADRAHELSVMDRQMELQKLGLNQRLEEVRLRSAAEEARAIYRTYATGIGWVDAFNGTVRPVLAYGFFLLYASVKCLQYHMLTTSVASVFDALNLLWNAEDQAIFAAVISFYFGQRAMIRAKR